MLSCNVDSAVVARVFSVAKSDATVAVAEVIAPSAAVARVVSAEIAVVLALTVAIIFPSAPSNAI